MKPGRLPILAIGLAVAALTAFSSEALALAKIRPPADWFFLGILYLTLVYFSLAYTLGHEVLTKKGGVDYTRKILQPCLFLIPMSLAFVSFGYQHFWFWSTLSNKEHINFEYIRRIGFTGIFVILWISSFVKPLRARIKFLNTACAAIGGHKNNSSALRYLITEILVSYILVLVYMYYSFAISGVSPEASIKLIFIPLFISGVGDPLSAIIGTRYGRRTYKVKVLLTGEIHTRTLESSLCIFLSTVFIINWLYFIHHIVNLEHYLIMMAIVPLLITVAEAKSPPRWNNPFIFLSAFVSIWASFWLAPIIFDVISPFALFCINNW